MTPDTPPHRTNDNTPRIPDPPAAHQPSRTGTTVILTGTLAVIAAKRRGTSPSPTADVTAAPDGDGLPAGAQTLDSLCRRVHAARGQVLSLRSGPGNTAPLLCARHALRVAIEDYVSTLHTLHFPIPTALRQEMLLYQRMHY